MNLYHTLKFFVVCSFVVFLLFFIRVSLILPKNTVHFHNFVYWWNWNKSSNWKPYLARLHDILKRLLAKVRFDASLMCLFRFIAFRATLNVLCCWTQQCGLLSRIHLRVTDQSWQTGANKFVSHFEVVFVVCWH